MRAALLLCAACGRLDFDTVACDPAAPFESITPIAELNGTAIDGGLRLSDAGDCDLDGNTQRRERSVRRAGRRDRAQRHGLSWLSVDQCRLYMEASNATGTDFDVYVAERTP